MSRPRGDPDTKTYGICASVTRKVKEVIMEFAKRENCTVAHLAGGILTEWALGPERGIKGEEIRLE